MPRYFFNIANGERHRDTQGLELPDQSAARREAIRFAGALLNDDPELIWDGHDFRVMVTDTSNKVVITVIMLAVDAEAMH